MPDVPISGLTTQTTIHDADLVPMVDTTDTTQSVNGTTKKSTWTTIVTYLSGKFVTTAGNAATATKLATPIYIDGVSFDGSASVSGNFPEGFLINGKIAVSVTSNNITLSILGMNGSAPSANNPVYCRINSVIRTITAALSVTVNAGANSFNAGSAELATKEIDYFAYLGYNATDGVTLGFSRIPFAAQYSDFSATATNEKFCAISTITHAASTDYYNVIGRFAATLGASATYYWTVPTYTAINLIQRPIFETRTLVYTPGYNGWTASPTTTGAYRISYNELEIINLTVTGTSSSTTTQSSLPFTPVNTVAWFPYRSTDNSVTATTPGMVGISASATVSFYKDWSGTLYTGSGTKTIDKVVGRISIG
jgi:hypothetical protein